MIGFIMELQYPNQKITLNSQPGMEHFEQRDSENKSKTTFVVSIDFVTILVYRVFIYH